MYPYSRLRKTFFGGVPEPSDRQIRWVWIAVAILAIAFLIFAGVLHLLPH